MGFQPIICAEIKSEMEDVQVGVSCNYAGCGVNNDGWPW